MSNNSLKIGYNGLNDIDNDNKSKSGDSIGIAFRINSASFSLSKGVDSVQEKNKKINRVYNIFGAVLMFFFLFSLVCFITGRIMDRPGAVLLCTMALISLIAINDDWKNWRKNIVGQRN